MILPKIIVFLLVSSVISLFVILFFFRQRQLKRIAELEKDLSQRRNILLALGKLEKIILDTLDFKQTVQKIVDSLLLELDYLQLGYRIVVLALVHEEEKVLKRISMSQTSSAEAVMGAGDWRFHDIVIPFSAVENYCIKAVFEKRSMVTYDWADIMSPPMPKEEARRLQQVSGVKTSMIFPVSVKGKVLGVLIFSMTKKEDEVSDEEMNLINGFTDLVGLTVQNASLYTNLQETSKELAVANEKLKELDKLKDEFVSVASHELRTPMTAIKSYLWMALNKKKKDLSPDLARYLDRSYISVERLISMVNDMLNISRIEGGRVALRLSEVDIVELAHEVIEELTPKANEKGLELVVEDRQMPKVLCDKDKIHEVYLNLAGNSLKFTPAGGKITISFEQKSPYLFVTVADTGRGIAQEDIGRLFTKFGRLENSYVAVAESGGTGLGLYITKSLVEFHKGIISVASEGLGYGAQFTFSLPIAYTPVADLLQKEAPKETGQTKELEKTTVTL